MKKACFLLLAAITCPLIALAQFGIGLRDNNYAYLSYTLHDSWMFKIEHSAFTESFKYQYFRINAGYLKNVWKAEIEGTPYFGTTYKNNFYNLGLQASVTLHAVKWIDAKVTVNPHYDSFYGYNTCFLGGVAVNATKNISIIAQYSDIPEYRIKEERLRVGFNFHVRNLSVSPILSVPINSDSKSRLLVSFDYRF